MRRTLTLVLVGAILLAGCMGSPSGSETTADGNATTAAATTGSGSTATPASTAAPTATTTATTPERTTTTERPPTPTTTARKLPENRTYWYADNVSIGVKNGELPFDQNATYARVQRLLKTDVAPPPLIWYVKGMEGLAGSANQEDIALDSKDEAVLAHEVVHSILTRAYPTPATSGPDETFANDATVEGVAEYVEAVYERKYLDERPSPVTRLPRDPARAYFIARYYYGYQYVKQIVDDPSEVALLHANPPNTSEEVIHGLAPGSEPPTDLYVTPANKHYGSEATWRYRGLRQLGELSLLITLRTRLPTEKASRGAAGWGNDNVMAFENGDRMGFVWTINMDDSSEADELTRIAKEFASADPPSSNAASDSSNTGNTPYEEFTNLIWSTRDPDISVRRVDSETVALVIGPSSFVENVELSGDASEVTVTVD